MPLFPSFTALSPYARVRDPLAWMLAAAENGEVRDVHGGHSMRGNEACDDELLFEQARGQVSRTDGAQERGRRRERGGGAGGGRGDGGGREGGSTHGGMQVCAQACTRLGARNVDLCTYPPRKRKR